MTIERRRHGPWSDPVESHGRRAAQSDRRWRVRTSGSTKALRILVAEDDAVIGMLLFDLLSGMGHLCIVVTTEAGAVIHAIRYSPDLMIVDAQLGDGSGIAAVDEILRAGPMPHLFVSGNALLVSAQRPSAVVLQKPFREADLTRAIQQTVGDAQA
jgi:CheY-like chemotaxis protein